MSRLRLAWEPINITPLEEIENRLRIYLKGKSGGVTIMGNGSLIFSPSDRNNMQDAKEVMNCAKFLIDFQVVEMKEGGYMVNFDHTTTVFISDNEFRCMRKEIIKRYYELIFPEEVFMKEDGIDKEHLLIGLYARGKLQYDAYNFSFYKRIEGIEH